MKRVFNILYLILLLLTIEVCMYAQQSAKPTASEVNSKVITDSVDRSLDDFVIASLIISDPGTFMYSVLGHSCIRLQCPTFNLDYCYTYEAENADNKVLAFLSGNLMMGLYAIPTEDYCVPYAEEGRGVYEYVLNLPIDVKRELWRVLDEHLAEGIRLPYDYYHRGCATTALEFVKEALGETEIVYDKSLYEQSLNSRKIWIDGTQRALWVRFIALFIAGGETSVPLYGEKQLIIPTDLVRAWQQAMVNGKPLLASEPNILVEGEPQVADGWFTPMVLAIILLILSIANLSWKRPYFDWLMLATQTLIGCFMTYLICFSDLCCTSWNWLIIPFNPLPLIFWHWRKHWALPCTGALVIWCIAMAAMTLLGHVLVDWSHIVIVMVWAIIILKQSKCLSIKTECKYLNINH